MDKQPTTVATTLNAPRNASENSILKLTDFLWVFFFRYGVTDLHIEGSSNRPSYEDALLTDASKKRVN